MTVNLKLTTALFIAGVVASATSSQALTQNAKGTMDSSNPYAVIVDRNIFHLTSPPPPPPVDTKPKDMPKVYLSGIIKIGDEMKVLFSIPPKDNKSPTAYLSLAQGEKDNDVELLSVSGDQQSVDIMVSGIKETLTMASNTLAAAGIRPSGGNPAPPPPPGAAPMHAGAPAYAGNGIIAGGGGQSSSPYGGVTVAGGGGSPPAYGGGGFGGALVSGGSSIGAGGNPGSQIGNLLNGGSPTGTPQNLAPENVVPPGDPQAKAYAEEVAKYPTLPVPPGILNPNWSPHNQGGGAGK
jgi:hypothetical protein